MGAIPQRVLDRIFDKVDVRGPYECWPWKLSIGTHGYGNAGWWDKTVDSRRGTTAHRAAWEATNGPIPDGLTVDHLCHNRACCNPAHLRLLTNLENASDNGFATKTHCPKGHPYDEVNTYRDGRGRRCRECARIADRSRKRRWTPKRREAQRAYRARRKAAL